MSAALGGVELPGGTATVRSGMNDADYIIVGSGINALVCAAILGRKDPAS